MARLSLIYRVPRLLTRLETRARSFLTDRRELSARSCQSSHPLPVETSPPSLLNDRPFISKAYNRSTTGLLSAVSHVSAIYYPGTLYTGHCTPPRGPRAWHSACESDSAAVTSIMIAGGIERERGREGGSQIYPVNKVPAIFQTSSAFCYWEK